MPNFTAAITAVQLRHSWMVSTVALLTLWVPREMDAQDHVHHPPECPDTMMLTSRDSAAGEHDMGTPTTPGMRMLRRPLDIPMSRMGSGTAWLPDASPMRAYHIMPDGWVLMVHGDVIGYYDHQGTVRGDDQVGSTNWAMLMAMRPLGRGMLHLHSMLSTDPFTVGARGYPLLLQTGEAYKGAPLRDRQHPHDMFMELSARYEVPVGSNTGLSIFTAPVGEPAIGPVAYMHRPSGQNDPFAPLGHHWADATHITFGVVTAGVFTRTVQLEGTLFHGREPDEARYDFDFGALDSYGGRLTVNPSPHWSVAASYGYLHSPEALHPDANQHRLGASILHTVRFGQHGDWASALVYGANKETTPGEPSDGSGNSVLLESNLQFDDQNSLFGRVEWVQKSAQDLVITDVTPDTRFNLTALMVGYVREVAQYAGASLGLGVRASVGFLPNGLQPTYGTRTPAGVVIFARLRPAILQRAHAGEPSENPDGDVPHDEHMPHHPQP